MKGLAVGETSQGTVRPIVWPVLLLDDPNLHKALQEFSFRSRLTDEQAARDELREYLAARFGADKVGCERVIGGFTRTRIDIDLDGRFGVEVKHAASLFQMHSPRAGELERALGQLVLYRRAYAPENIILVVAGDISSEQRAAFREVYKLVHEQGCACVHIR